MIQILKVLHEYCLKSTFKALQMEKFYNSRVKEAVYPVYFTGNMADYAMVHRRTRKKSRPVLTSGDL